MAENEQQGGRCPDYAEEQIKRKKEIRRDALKRRDGITETEHRKASGRILERLTALPCYQDADSLLTYVSFRSEVDTFPLLERALADGKAVFVPRVAGREMDFFRIFSREDLSEGYRGILEPKTTDLFNDRIGQNILICLPGAAFDRNCHRIGYGGGFYDRYISGLFKDDGKSAGKAQTKVTTVALAFACQIYEEIPWEAHDVRPSCIITEQEMIWL